MPRRAQIHPTDPVARRLFLSRTALGYEEQGKFAEALGMLPNTYNEYEKGKKPLTLAVVRLIESKFGLTVEWLLNGVPDRLPHGLVKKLEALGALPPASALHSGTETRPRK